MSACSHAERARSGPNEAFCNSFVANTYEPHVTVAVLRLSYTSWPRVGSPRPLRDVGSTRVQLRAADLRSEAHLRPYCLMGNVTEPDTESGIAETLVCTSER